MAGAAKVAIITGAGSGVGRATAQALAKGGFALVLAGRRAEPLEETVRLVAPAQAIAVPTDVSNPASVKALFDKAVEAFGRVDVVFNNKNGPLCHAARLARFNRDARSATYSGVRRHYNARSTK